MRILRSGDGGNIFAIETNFYMCLADRLPYGDLIEVPVCARNLTPRDCSG